VEDKFREMGKRIIQQRRGRGTLTYRVRKRAYRFKIQYPLMNIKGKAKVLKLINSPGHSAPLAKIQIGKEIFYNPAFKGMIEGQEIEIGKPKEIKKGDIVKLKDLEIGMKIYNIEKNPGDGGKLIRSGGSSAVLVEKTGDKGILRVGKRSIEVPLESRASVGEVAGQGRLEKPILKAGKKFYLMKSKGKLWPRTSAVAMNAVDHPFGSGRGKKIKSKVPKRDSPPGLKVGLLRPKKTGRRKR